MNINIICIYSGNINAAEKLRVIFNHGKLKALIIPFINCKCKFLNKNEVMFVFIRKKMNMYWLNINGFQIGLLCQAYEYGIQQDNNNLNNHHNNDNNNNDDDT